MNCKRWTITLMVVLTLFLGVGGTVAQNPEPRGEVSISAAVNSRISYQGVLKEDGSPVTGSRDMVFRLYSDVACTSQVGSDIAKPGVSLADGLFSVELDVAHDDLNGQGLWLEVEVGGTAIVCQEILPVPYALSLRPGATIMGEEAGSPILTVENSSTANDSRAIRGYASAATGFTTGVNGRTDSSSTGAKGVWGYAAGGGQTYGVYGETGSVDGYGLYGTNTAGGYAGYFDGDVAQSRASDGLVKAAVHLHCGSPSTIDRYFNNVADTISIEDEGPSWCDLDFNFDVTDRFWLVEGDGGCIWDSDDPPEWLHCSSGDPLGGILTVLIY